MLQDPGSCKSNQTNHDSFPLVSVCIPTYNRCHKLQKAINSLQSCTHSNIEIVISDNASSDDTQTVCLALAKSESRIKYFRHPENQGPTKNFEFARAQATGKYFLWLADDDYLDPNYITACVQEMENDPTLVLVSGLAAFHRDDGKLARYGEVLQPNSSVPLLRVLKYFSSVGDNTIFYGMYRLNQIRDCKLPNCLSEDLAFVADVLLIGKAKVIPNVYVHREFENSTGSSLKKLARTLALPHWHANYPRLAVATNLASHLAKSQKFQGMWQLERILIYFLVIGTLLVKYARSTISQVPFAKKIYRKYFQSARFPN